MSITMTRPTRRIEFCTVADLYSAHEAAVAALADASKRAEQSGMENGGGEKLAAAKRIADLEAEMREHTVVFTLEAWPRKRWIEFEESNPPREGRADDKNFDLNVEALGVVLAGEKNADHDWPSAIKSVESLDGASVEFDPSTEWAPLADAMTSGQWNDFALAVLQLNRGGVTKAPFSLAASRLIQRSGAN